MLACDAGTAGILYVTLFEDALFIVDCGAVQLILQNEGIDPLDAQRETVGAVLTEHSCQWREGPLDSLWLSRRVEDGETLNAALAAMQTAVEALLRGLRGRRNQTAHTAEKE